MCSVYFVRYFQLLFMKLKRIQTLNILQLNSYLKKKEETFNSKIFGKNFYLKRTNEKKTINENIDIIYISLKKFLKIVVLIYVLCHI